MLLYISSVAWKYYSSCCDDVKIGRTVFCGVEFSDSSGVKAIFEAASTALSRWQKREEIKMGVSCIRILLARWRQHELKVSSGEGMGSPIIFFAVLMTLWKVPLSAAEQFAYHTVL